MTADPAIWTGSDTDVAAVLNRAADLIEERGWAKGNCGMLATGPTCLEGAIAAASGLQVETRTGMGLIYSYAHVGDLPAYKAVESYLNMSSRLRVYDWNDEQTSAAPVVEALRAAALIAAAETSPRTVESWTPEAELTPVTVAGMAS